MGPTGAGAEAIVPYETHTVISLPKDLLCLDKKIRRDDPSPAQVNRGTVLLENPAIPYAKKVEYVTSTSMRWPNLWDKVRNRLEVNHKEAKADAARKRKAETMRSASETAAQLEQQRSSKEERRIAARRLLLQSTPSDTDWLANNP